MIKIISIDMPRHNVAVNKVSKSQCRKNGQLKEMVEIYASKDPRSSCLLVTHTGRVPASQASIECHGPAFTALSESDKDWLVHFLRLLIDGNASAMEMLGEDWHPQDKQTLG